MNPRCNKLYLQVVKVTVIVVLQTEGAKSECDEQTRVHIHCPIAVPVRWIVTWVPG